MKQKQDSPSPVSGSQEAECVPGQAQSVTEPNKERYWLIFFEDDEASSEAFTDERAARYRFQQLQDNWNCHLLAPDSELVEARAEIANKETARMGWAKAADHYRHALEQLQDKRSTKCSGCGTTIYLPEVYRCGDCSQPFCKHCLKRHFEKESGESKEALKAEIMRLRERDYSVERLETVVSAARLLMERAAELGVGFNGILGDRLLSLKLAVDAAGSHRS